MACFASNLAVLFIGGAFGLPLWAFLASIPFLMYAQLYISSRYTARAGMTLGHIPETGYENRIDALDNFRFNLTDLGFHKTDEFFLPMTLNTVAFVQHHEREPVLIASYHTGLRLIYELITYFEDGVSLTTSAFLISGTIRRPQRKMLQIFNDRPCDELFQMHMRAIEFLKQHGTHPGVLPSSFRERYMESHREVSSIMRSPLFMLKFYYWSLTQRARLHCKPIQEQYLAKTIKLS
jgi:hypothetical protein